MNILVTGAKGMVGTALCNNLKNIRDGKNKTRPALDIKEIFEYDLDSTPAELDENFDAVLFACGNVKGTNGATCAGREKANNFACRFSSAPRRKELNAAGGTDKSEAS